MVGFLVGACWAMLAALTSFFLGVAAEQTSLEDVAEPLSAEDADTPLASRGAGQHGLDASAGAAATLSPLPPPYAGSAPVLTATSTQRSTRSSRQPPTGRCHVRSWRVP